MTYRVLIATFHGATGLAALVVATYLLTASQTLPGCDSPASHERLATAINHVPALAAQHASLVAVNGVTTRGFKGRRAMRACQAWLVTTKGSGMLEYSIHPATDTAGNFMLKAELFQGGWREVVLSTGCNEAANCTQASLRF